MEWNVYLKNRELYQELARKNFESGNESEGEYMVGVVRGLDLAMGVDYVKVGN